MTKFRSLYVHFPFCEARCHYCDFYALGRDRTGATDSVTFESALLREVEAAQPCMAERLDTVFFGGGTPSLSSIEFLERLVDRLPKLEPGGEWTMECNPSSLTPELVAQLSNLGINRVSLGVQATQQHLLSLLGRVHDHTTTMRALDALFSGGITNVSCDLLCGVPGQTLEDLSQSIDRLLAFPLKHLSCYLLTLPKHHKMFKDLPSEEIQEAHLLHIHDELERRGYRRYEVSNFARPGFESRHNLVYWRGGGYLGLGPSAHSYDPEAKSRWKNVSSLHGWADALARGMPPTESQETLTPDQIELESWMLGLRLSEGVPDSWFESPRRRTHLKTLTAQKLIERHPEVSSRVRLTPRGFPLSDSIVQMLVS